MSKFLINKEMFWPVFKPYSDSNPGFESGFDSGFESGFESGSETYSWPDPEPDPKLLFRIRNTASEEKRSLLPGSAGTCLEPDPLLGQRKQFTDPDTGTQ